MNKFSAVPRRLPSITKHKVSMLRPVCMEHQITFQQIAELGLIGTGEWTEEDGLLINLAKVRARVVDLLTTGQWLHTVKLTLKAQENRSLPFAEQQRRTSSCDDDDDDEKVKLLLSHFKGTYYCIRFTLRIKSFGHKVAAILRKMCILTHYHTRVDSHRFTLERPGLHDSVDENYR
ncbi:hypothetical protein JOB18_046823 [Solea senegalensis]|uniref:Uncharacterized protein n=1 Tax=Solea senegalensis TaxID=28829 RepID=A0AAV6S2I8_SOLSE|nr:hypothetical protein JOB18_046823 [Solea senegalensis]